MFTKVLRRLVAKKCSPYQFFKYQDNIDFDVVPDELGLYVHIPFCTSLCPFCPYNKVLYEAGVVREYKLALFKELSLLRASLAGRKISSVYFGGGTPTLMIDEISELLCWLRQEFGFTGDIGIELHPREATQEKLVKIKAAGINLVSLGVQTFDDSTLLAVGRNHSGSEAREALAAVSAMGFDCVDVDIMFNLPHQTAADIERDILTCYQAGVDQLSIYPLILFPLTSLPEKIKQDRVRLFTDWQEYRLLKKIEGLSSQFGYQRTSVWTYGRPGTIKYTSVTRESFIGVGAGATSQFANYFYLNTFDVRAYIDRVNQGRLPINLVNTMSHRERMVYWLFWRCYESTVDLGRFEELFDSTVKAEFPVLLNALRLSGLVRTEAGTIRLTRMGAYLYHLVEKHYSKTYLNDTWAASMASPWLDNFSL